jgi:hypothetical protein
MSAPNNEATVHSMETHLLTSILYISPQYPKLIEHPSSFLSFELSFALPFVLPIACRPHHVSSMVVPEQ